MSDFLKCLFAHVSSHHLLEKMESHISCIFVISSIVCFHMCSQIACLKRCKVAIVACVSFSQMWIFTCATNRLLEQMKSHNSCRCAKFLHYDFQIACLNRCKVTLVAYAIFLKCFFSHVSSNRLIEDMQSHISCICVIFSDVCFHRCSQIACLNRCKGKIVADV